MRFLRWLLALLFSHRGSPEPAIPAVTLAPISVTEAKAVFEKQSGYRGEFNIAIAAREGDTVHGVIALKADGLTFALGHIYTDGNAQVGSLLYGGAWRTAKAMGYKTIAI